jgi:hypothetical protein
LEKNTQYYQEENINMNSQKLRKYAQIFGAMCGGLLISLPAISQTALAQQPTSTTPRQSTSNVNPCPSVFYEEPHNNRVVVPEGCPPNAITQRLANQGLLPTAGTTNTSSPSQAGLGVGGETPNQDTSVRPQSSTSTTTTPLPSQQQPPSATIALASGKVNISLVNDTAATITYQVIGDTAPRTLQGKSSVMLQGISAPATVTFERQDGGLLSVTPQPSSEQQGMLEVKLNETTDVAQDKKAMRIQENGAVFLN